jgi:hypothetical protein
MPCGRRLLPSRFRHPVRGVIFVDEVASDRALPSSSDATPVKHVHSETEVPTQAKTPKGISQLLSSSSPL